MIDALFLARSSVRLFRAVARALTLAFLVSIALSRLAALTNNQLLI